MCWGSFTGPYRPIWVGLGQLALGVSLLVYLRFYVRKRMGPHGIGKIYGQEKNITTYNLARMNMLLHGVKDTEFDIFHGDTLLNEWE